MLGHEGRGTGLVNKVRAYALQQKGMDTVDANLHLGFNVDGRSYEDASSILQAMGVRNMRLMTNNKEKVNALKHLMKESIQLPSSVTQFNRSYLKTKVHRLDQTIITESTN